MRRATPVILALLASLAPLAASAAPLEGVDSTEEEANEVEGPNVREVPRNGHGLLVLGTAGTVLGVALISTGVASIVIGETAGDSAALIPAVTLTTGPAIMSLGGVALHYGIQRRRAYRTWQAAQPEDVPPQGLGLVATGGVLVVSGFMGTMIGVLAVVSEGAPPGPIAATAIGGGSVLASGIAMMGVGSRRYKRFGRWQRETTGAAELTLLPTLSLSRRGVSLGLAGQF